MTFFRPLRLVLALAATGCVGIPMLAAQQPPPRPADMAPAADMPDVALVRDAVAAYRRGDLSAGDALRARATSPAAGAFLDWAALRIGGIGVSFDRVLAFATAYPDFPGQSWLRRRGEDALLAERKPAPVVRAYFTRERPQSPGGKLALAQAFRADGLGEDAAALIRDAWRNDMFGRDLELRILDAFKDTLTTADHRARMARFLGRENWDGGRRAASYAGDGHDAVVKARAAVEQRARNAAKLLEAVPPTLKDDVSAMFARVQLLRRSEKAEEAAKLLSELPRDPAVLVDGDVWWVERRLVARKLLDDGDPKAAYAVVTGHGATTAERRIEAEFTAGWIALRFMKDPALARSHFERVAGVAGTPISRARAAYWRGRAAEAAGEAEEARRLYGEAAEHDITYYGQLAAAKIGRSEVTLRRPLDGENPARQAAARQPMVEAVALAYAAGMRELALPLALEFGRGSTEIAELEALAGILVGNGDTRGLLTLGKLATQRGLPLDEAAFPTSGIPDFEPLGSGVEPAMVHAIARQESAFDPAAGSSAGARGLMQLMPGTAQATARKAGIPYEPGRILDATYNARLGSAHLADLMEDWRGAYILVFASYNAGPGNARKWIQAYGDPRDPAVDAVDWVERIPFSETRNYVQRVMENLQVYRRRLDTRHALAIETDLKAGGPRATTAAAGPEASPPAPAAAAPASDAAR
ncbi:lytic transglycosylase domain-containing protein [Enterovirga sp.]|jgi:soluble lytic murein transglycosylase|uniref:lytic transglycosylase domain-containing protein n=1 Tax=Enterovirga sp. TaxID=2026350 RepID=UPI002616A9E1|nr:lytic transglycosylase domain-containing protein [Enterovirga sp.]MDB5592712.1 Lytic transglycosylase catalytic [Enterovirga sp.]